MEEATFLTKFGKSVRIVHRRDSLRVSKILQQKALENPKIEFIWNNVVADIKGNNKISTVLVKDINTGKERTIDTGGLLWQLATNPILQFSMDNSSLTIRADRGS